MRNLSKSKLTAYRQCPKRLWLEIHQPELKDDSGSEAAFAVGHQVGDVAQRIYDPRGEGENVDPNLHGWDAARERTKSLLESGERPIFEALLQIPGAFALIDVMLPDWTSGQLRWQIIEVKASTGVRDYQRDDVALQSYIAERMGVPVAKIGVAHIDNQFVYPGNEDYAGLLHFEDLTGESRERHTEVAKWVAEAQAVAAMESVPDIAVGDHCQQPFPCGFCNHCWQAVPQAVNPIEVLPRIGNAMVKDWELQGITELQDVPDAALNDKQLRVKSVMLSGETYFDAPGAARALAFAGGDAYFMDFETIQFGVPIWQGTRPYQQIPFQFSVHSIAEDGTMGHAAFLDLSGDDPREPFIQELIKACGSAGPIYVYNAGFERSRLNELAAGYPDHAQALGKVIERMVDLLPIAREYYCNPEQRGSWSLKAMLRCICNDPGYEALDEVQDGQAAGQAFLKAIDTGTSPGERETIRKNLLEYCKLDTLATVKLWQMLK